MGINDHFCICKLSSYTGNTNSQEAESLYLWCKQCEHAYPIEQWTHNGQFKYGVCPNTSCSAWQYSVAIEWEAVALANDYPAKPDPLKTYPLQTVLF